MDRFEVQLNPDQAKALKIAKAFVWGEAAQVILDNIDSPAWELRELCLIEMRRGLDQATTGQYSQDINDLSHKGGN